MRAYVLTHTARCGPPVYRDRMWPCAPQLDQVFRACAVRDAFHSDSYFASPRAQFRIHGT
eukprot:2524210-Pyramimonas_sp.AAC.1